MAQTLTIAGTSYLYADVGETYGQAETDAMVAVCANALWGSGGVVTYLVSATANPADAGQYRLAHTDYISWRNAANSGNLELKPNASTDVPEFNGNALAYKADYIPLVSPVTTGNIVKQTAGGTLEDAGVAASDVTTIAYPWTKAGMIVWYDEYYAASATFPFYCLINASAVITTANWPDLVSQQRAKVLRTGVTQIAFTVIKVVVDVGGTTATIDWEDATLENSIGAALLEDAKVHNEASDPETASYSNWRTITFPTGGAGSADHGLVTAGTWYITGIDTGTKQMTISGSGWTRGDGAGEVIAVDCAFYPNRVGDTETAPTTKARIFKIGGRALVAHDDDLDLCYGGLRRRDYLQGHYHSALYTAAAVGAGGGSWAHFEGSASGTNTQVTNPYTDGTNGVPRTGKNIEPRSMIAYPYLWGKTYIP